MNLQLDKHYHLKASFKYSDWKLEFIMKYKKWLRGPRFNVATSCPRYEVSLCLESQVIRGPFTFNHGEAA